MNPISTVRRETKAMAKAGAKDDDYNDLNDAKHAESGGANVVKKDKKSLQSAFANWKKRQAGKAQPKSGNKGSDSDAKSAHGGAKGIVSDAKSTDSTSKKPAAQAKPPAPYVAEANRPKEVRNLLDMVVDW